jgi:hypothetical protein
VDDAPPKPRFKIGPNAWATAQWGLASVLFNAVVLLIMPIASAGYAIVPISIRLVDFWDEDSLVATSILMVVIPAVGTAFTLIGLVFGFSGWFVAASRKQPQALHVAGSLLAILSLIFWVALIVVGAVLADGIWNITSASLR